MKASQKTFRTMRQSSQSPNLRRLQATATNISGVRFALDKRSDLVVSNIWVKLGRIIIMDEVNTQRFVAQYLQANNITAVRAPRVYFAFTWGIFGYIMTEYIDGQTCDNSDISLVAATVQALINIPSPGSTSGTSECGFSSKLGERCVLASLMSLQITACSSAYLT